MFCHVVLLFFLDETLMKTPGEMAGAITGQHAENASAHQKSVIYTVNFIISERTPFFNPVLDIFA